MKYLLAILCCMGWLLAVIESSRANFWEQAAAGQCRDATGEHIARAVLFVKLHDWQTMFLGTMTNRPLYKAWQAHH